MSHSAQYFISQKGGGGERGGSWIWRDILHLKGGGGGGEGGRSGKGAYSSLGLRENHAVSQSGN